MLYFFFVDVVVVSVDVCISDVVKSNAEVNFDDSVCSVVVGIIVVSETTDCKVVDVLEVILEVVCTSVEDETRVSTILEVVCVESFSSIDPISFSFN